MHKCDTCQYKGEHQEMGMRAFGVCTMEPNLVKATLAYRATECPFAAKEEKQEEMPRENPECPYCGKKMSFHGTKMHSCFYCRGCNARTPVVLGGKEEALEAAMERPMQKPIPLEDIVETFLVTPCWVEYRERFTFPNAVILDRDSVDIFRKSDREYLPRKEYGKTWRAWLRFPTDEERKATEWKK